MGCDEQALAVALRVNGELTVAPFAGLVMVTAAKAGAQRAAARPRERKRAFIVLRALTLSSEHTWSSCKISLAGDRELHRQAVSVPQLSLI
jgi:hypothetical protein